MSHTETTIYETHSTLQHNLVNLWLHSRI